MASPRELLQKQFPTVAKDAVERVLNQECNGDTNKAIIILMKIEQFNRSMNPNLPQQQPMAQQQPQQIVIQQKNIEGTEGVNTGNNNPNIVRVVQQIPQQQIIPLQIMQPNIANLHHIKAAKENNPHMALNLNPQEGCNSCCDPITCACCVTCCPSCFMIPDKYENGLYSIDLKIKNFSFIPLVLLSIYGEYNLLILESAYQALYIPMIGLIIILLASLSFYCSKSRYDSLICNKVIAVLFVIGGFLYFVGYVMYAFLVDSYNVCEAGGSVCDCSWSNDWSYSDGCRCDDGGRGWDECEYSWDYDWRFDYSANPLYFVMRGLFVFWHCILMTFHYITPDIKWFNNRLTLIKYDSLIFSAFAGCVIQWLLPSTLSFLFFFCIPLMMSVILLTNICLAVPSSNAGGCNGFATTGTLLVIFYCCSWILYISWSLDMSIHQDYIFTPQSYFPFGWGYWCWNTGIVIFSTVQFWIYLRLIHPGVIACCYKKIQQDVVTI